MAILGDGQMQGVAGPQAGLVGLEKFFGAFEVRDAGYENHEDSAMTISNSASASRAA
jgi:hypothetical protein